MFLYSTVFISQKINYSTWYFDQLQYFLFLACTTQGAKYVEEPNVAYQNDENTATSYNNSNVQLDFHPSHSKHQETNGVNEQQQGNIHSFENPQAVNTDFTTDHDTNTTIQDQYGSAYPI